LKKSFKAEEDQSITDIIIPAISTKHIKEKPIINPVSIKDPAYSFLTILRIKGILFFLFMFLQIKSLEIYKNSYYLSNTLKKTNKISW